MANSLNVMTVVGARPQFVKAAVVSRALTEAGIAEKLVHTGQHYDANMSAVFFEELELPPVSLSLGIGGGSHGQNTGRMIEALEAAMMDLKPDMVLVYGDTDSTLAGGIAASKLGVPVAHVEAGLRSYNRSMPEEINRVVTDHVSQLLFCTSAASCRTLKGEGIDPASIHNVGDVMFDAVKQFSEVARKRSGIMDRIGLGSGSYALLTFHRKENTDDAARLRSILEGIGRIDGKILFPVHPRTKARMIKAGLSAPANVIEIDPVGYFDMLLLEANARLIITDSGGVQKEAYYHGVPCAILREETEWTELLEARASVLTGADSQRITKAAQDMQKSGDKKTGIYGDGEAARKIAALIGT
ncbi:UDP-N-acetylglucosamine 2-epimerase (non-hydrolyzing) [uncultured Hoeflea sp.]|uniref:non-hydrolyzing UDP-N-acetylglucosamine 2-epimerase n=1 Tax=uncultured Hoeflea sp. TaxID=538666 RepID=UPI00260804F6|nr:UDP-N-acetylglucosamine 2-epimerase (non-hydrolyzing) [uncultured Hoeflea sp.]